MAQAEQPHVARTVAELVARVAAAGGELQIPDPTGAERRRWRQTLFVASTEGGLPEGKRLRFSGRDRGDLIIRMVDDIPGNQPRPPILALEPIPVPDTLRGLHPLLAGARDRARKGGDGWIDTRHAKGILNMRIAADSLRRTLRLARALISEAERRGGSAQECSEGIGIALRDPTIVVGLVFTEDTDKRPHQLTPAELRDQEVHERKQRLGQYSWIAKPPKYDHSPSGRLELRDRDISSYASTILANDRTRWTFESRLRLAMQKIEAMTAEIEQARAAARVAAEERRCAWASAVELARERWFEIQRTRALDGLLADRRRRLEIQTLVDELAEGHGPEPEGAGDEWLRWIVSEAAKLDLAVGPLRAPELPEPTDDDLQELLGSAWRIHGPDEGRRTTFRSERGSKEAKCWPQR